jgi:hypothetical protein
MKIALYARVSTADKNQNPQNQLSAIAGFLLSDRVGRLPAKRAGLGREKCKRWLGHKTDSMFDWYSIDPDENEIIEQGEKIAASLRSRRKSAAAS